MATERPSAFALAAAGLLSLAVAMGIGRFSFTPMLPLMIREGQLDVAVGGWIAAANYAGYLAGALTAARVPLGAPRLGIVALVATAVLTALMAWPGFVPWMLWRFFAGVASAWVFVATAVWCLGALAARGEHHRGGFVYAGVGAGIALAGLYCWAAGALRVAAASLWVQLAVLAAVLMLPVVTIATRIDSPAPAPRPKDVAGAPPRAPAGLVWCYGAMGFGYILPATFLPVLARNVIDDPLWFGLAWPVFGATAALSAVVAPSWMRRASRLAVWSRCQWAMGVGALLPSLWPGAASIALSALLVGGTFMIITLAGVQEIRARVPDAPTAAVGRMTAAFAWGQIAGPVASALLLHIPALRERGLELALQAAAGVLFASAWWLQREAASHSTKEMSHAR
ncbi:MAG TPA: YbfB/YjiJ family MFS transporter [Ramlibacter sp.]|uniref:YbfB/YjiJ family MFS transporter n=1 Tax=Ramlibacter sp. TaxID=1917967 RepID=UPI002BF4F8C1|nr:YbfB/YjiJ family MFS transporter [Ramlibacter sp.]HVZ42706.1 YbfB/YjiJ family MFS transporter [Ramlibacter sp.]